MAIGNDMKNWRINLILILIFAFGAAITGRLIYIQIIKHDYYKALSQGQKIFQSLKGERGKIFFKGGQVLAANFKGINLFASPAEIKEKEKTAEEISRLLSLEKEELLENFKKDALFEEIKKELTEEEYVKIKELDLAGIYAEENIFRKYPQEFMASHTVGFLGGEGQGQYGIEGYYNDALKEKEGFWENILGNHELDGKDIYLTLDYNIQFMAEKLLSQARENLAVESGQIIVAEPSSGKILALANWPNFNPNNYSEEKNYQIFRNSAIQKLYEPGSVFKAITMAGALDKEKITPQTTYIDTGKVKIGGWTIYNYNEREYGEQTMTQVLEKSINTGAVFAEKQLGHSDFMEYIGRFGFFEATGIDLEEEIFSENEGFKKGYEINFSNGSFGQGIEVTPIQLVRAFSAIANGGKLVKPYIVERIIEDGKAIEIQPEVSKSNIISQKTASQLTAMLVNVVENGFAKGAKVPGYYIAGKTGTSQVSWSSLGISQKGYSDKTWQTFIGFAPAFSPKFLILIKFDNPKTKTAEYSVVPVFQELAKYIIDYLQIPPDYE